MNFVHACQHFYSICVGIGIMTQCCAGISNHCGNMFFAMQAKTKDSFCAQPLPPGAVVVWSVCVLMCWQLCSASGSWWQLASRSWWKQS